jgi:hypothetical protein
MTWNAQGSYLYHLISEQLIENETTNEIGLKEPLSSLKVNQDRIGYLYDYKTSFESIIQRVFDLDSDMYKSSLEGYASTLLSNQGKAKPLQMLEIYKTLFTMFDINLSCIQINEANEGRFEFQSNIDDTHLENLLEFYEFKGLIELDRIKEEQKQFFETFFEKLSVGEKEWLVAIIAQADRDRKNLFSMENRNGWAMLRERFISFVKENNEKKFVPVISFLATNYLCLPSIVGLNQLQINNAFCVSNSHMSMQSLEEKLKLLNSIKSPLSVDLDTEYCGSELSQVPYIDLFD